MPSKKPLAIKSNEYPKPFFVSARAAVVLWARQRAMILRHERDCIHHGTWPVVFTLYLELELLRTCTGTVPVRYIPVPYDRHFYVDDDYR